MKTITNTYLGFLETKASKEITERLEAEARLEKEQRYNEIMALLPEWLEKNRYTYNGVFHIYWNYNDKLEDSLHDLVKWDEYSNDGNLHNAIHEMIHQVWSEGGLWDIKNEATDKFIEEFGDEFAADIEDAIIYAEEDWDLETLVIRSYGHRYNDLNEKNQLNFDRVLEELWDLDYYYEYSDIMESLRNANDEEKEDILVELENLRQTFWNNVEQEILDYFVLNGVNVGAKIEEVFEHPAVKALGGENWCDYVVSVEEMSVDKYFELLCTGEFTDEMFKFSKGYRLPVSMIKYAREI